MKVLSVLTALIVVASISGNTASAASTQEVSFEKEGVYLRVTGPNRTAYVRTLIAAGWTPYVGNSSPGNGDGYLAYCIVNGTSDETSADCTSYTGDAERHGCLPVTGGNLAFMIDRLVNPGIR